MDLSFKQAIRWNGLIATLLGISTLTLMPTTSMALTYALPKDGNIVGNIQYTKVHQGDSLSTIGREFDIGGYEMVEANPGVDFSNPKPGKRLVVPSRFILPDGPRKGIVVNLAEMRLYYYHPDGARVSTYPVGIGQEGWNTKLGKTQVVRKRENPTWVVPDSIMENHKDHGMDIPKVQPPGPKNPLGKHAITLGYDNLVIHGTPYPKGVGVRSSHGCIRMLPEDVAELYQYVSVGTPVEVINQPNKIGHDDKKIFLEAHVPVDKAAGATMIGDLIHRVARKNSKNYSVQWREVTRAQVKPQGYPIPIGSLFQ